MTTFKKILASSILLIWFLLGIYFGTAGLIYEEQAKEINSIVDFTHMKSNASSNGNTLTQKFVYDGMTFESKEKAQAYIAADKLYHTFAWLDKIPKFLTLILTSCALGAFGGLISIIRIITIEKIPVEETQYISIPFLGLLLGMVVLGISFVVPNLLTANKDIELSHTSLVFFSLFVGIFSKDFMLWLDKRFRRFIEEKG